MQPGTTKEGNVRLVEKPLSVNRIAKQIRNELQFLLDHADSTATMDDLLPRMMIVATDGASLMSGAKGGLAIVLQKLGAEGLFTTFCSWTLFTVFSCIVYTCHFLQPPFITLHVFSLQFLLFDATYACHRSCERLTCW